MLGTSVLKLSDTRNFGRTFTGLALILGPALMLVGTILGSAVDGERAAERFDQIARNETAYLLSGVLFLLGALLLLGAGVGLMRLFAGGGVTFGQVAAALLLVGSAAGVGGYVFGALEYAMATREGVDRAELARFVDQAEEAGIFIPVFVLFVVGVIIGLILLGIAAWRRGIVPVWAALLVVAAAVLAFAAESGALAIVSSAVLLAGLGWIGVALLRMSDDHWDAGASRPENAGPRARGVHVGAPGP